jgi:glycosyltransferase involved in cell wall biosynthesis
MEILRIAQNLYPEVPGGGSYHIHAMSRDQGKMGHDVTVVTITDDDDRSRVEHRDHYTVRRFRPTVSPLGNQLSAGLVRHLWDRTDVDVVHAHSHLYFATNIAALRRRLSSIPLAITNHGLYSQSAPEWVFEQYLRTVGKWTFNAADVVFCYTDEDRERLSTYDVSTDITVIPNGVDTNRFTAAGERSPLIDHDGPCVLFVGRLVDGKRPRDAIEVVDRLPRELDVKLYFVGDGPMRAELERVVVDRSLGAAVEFLGQRAYDEMPALYRSGDLLLLPSRAEGLPRTVLEAISTGIPVVASDLPQMASIVEAHGETVPVGDVEGFAAAVQRQLQSGRRSVELEDTFRWDDTVRRTTSALESLRTQSR